MINSSMEFLKEDEQQVELKFSTCETIHHTARPHYLKFIPFGARLSEIHIESLSKLSRLITRRRKNKQEKRVTSNSIIRSLLTVFLSKSHNLNFDKINNEEELLEEIRKLFR